MTETPAGRTKHFPQKKDQISAIDFGNDIKVKLALPLDHESFEALRKNSIEDILFFSRDLVTARWQERVQPTFMPLCSEWANSYGESPAEQRAASALKNSELFEKKMRIRQFSEMDSLRKTNPDAWYKIVRASMERQNAEIDMFVKAIEGMDESEFNGFGMNKQEVLLTCEIAQLVRDPINESFLRQMEIADKEGGSAKTPNSNNPDATYVWEEQIGEEWKMMTYNEKFHPMYDSLVQSITALREKITGLLSDNKIREGYLELNNLLERNQRIFESKNPTISTQRELWKDMYNLYSQFSVADCPTNATTSSYAYACRDAHKVDSEFRVGIKTNKTKELQDAVVPLQDIGFELAKQYDPHLTLKSKRITIQIADLILGAGSNTFWATQAEAGEGSIVGYLDVTDNVFKNMTLPFYEKVFGNKPSEAKREALIQDDYIMLFSHELGHTIVPSDDDAIAKRVGAGEGLNILEELKADTLSLKLISQSIDNKKDSSERKKTILENMTIMCLDYINNRDSGDAFGTGMYSRSGRIILSTLLESGALVKNEENFEIVDSSKGFEELIKLGDGICNMYVAETTTPETIVKRAAELLDPTYKNIQLDELIAASLR